MNRNGDMDVNERRAAERAAMGLPAAVPVPAASTISVHIDGLAASKVDWITETLAETLDYLYVMDDYEVTADIAARVITARKKEAE